MCRPRCVDSGLRQVLLLAVILLYEVVLLSWVPTPYVLHFEIVRYDHEARWCVCY